MRDSTFYQILSNPFYYGVIKRKGELYPGTHETMITKIEFDKVQEILGRPNRKPKTKPFAFTGLIRCGECGSMITAEHKINRFGSHYTYYRCTKHKGGIKNACEQGCIRDEELEKQVVSLLDKFKINDKFLEWIGGLLEKTKETEETLRAEMKQSLSKSLDECKMKLDNLLHLRLKELLTDEEYLAEKTDLADKKMNFENKLAQMETNPEFWFEPFQKVISFARLAKNSFLNGNDELKRKILETVGSNFFLKDRILLIETKKPFQFIIETAEIPLGWALKESNPRPTRCKRVALTSPEGEPLALS